MSCKHCGAPVKGTICEYCGMPFKTEPPVIVYKSDKSESTVSIPEKPHGHIIKFIVIILIIFVISRIIVSVISISDRQEKNHSYSTTTSSGVRVYDNHNVKHENKEHHTENRPAYDADEILRETGAFPDTKIYQIGVDIPEGLYIFIPTLSMGHGVQGVYSDPSCNNQISSAYVHFDGTRIVELKGNGYLEFSWCTAYNLDMHPEIVNDPHETDGMFIVGRDIEAGTYHLESPEKIFGDMSDYAEWFIYSDINAVGPLTKECGILETWGAYDENISDEITLHEGEYFELRHCIITD